MKTLKSIIAQYIPLKLVVMTLSAVTIFFATDLQHGQAAFELNFNPNQTSGHSYQSFNNCENYSINMSFMGNNDCGGRTINGGHDDGTGAFQRVFTANGKTYYHIIIGDIGSSSDTFFQEVYIEASGSSYQNGGGATSASAYTKTSDMNCSNTNTDCLYNMVTLMAQTQIWVVQEVVTPKG